MTKNQIIQTYQQAQTIKELEDLQEKVRAVYNKLLSYEQRQVYKFYINRMMELKLI